MLKSHAELLSAVTRSERGLSINELEAELKVTTPTLRLRVNDLLNQNKLVRIGLGLPGKPYRYCTPEQAANIDAEQPEPKDAEPVEPSVPVITPEEMQAGSAEPTPVQTPKPIREFQPALLKLEQPAGLLDQEIHAMQTMLAVLEPLDDMARSRAIGWVSSRLGLC